VKWSSENGAKGIPKATVARSLKGALCFELLLNNKQVGFARVISDFTTIAYLGDVFILPEQRGERLSTCLMDCITSHPDLQGMRRWILATSDAHDLYAKYGFTALKQPSAFMELHNPNVYALDVKPAI
jgi:predicted GNAT family N-acyltransferase